jgi:aryl-alcohol dehydrogenase-like predicted oxidoreductase
MGKLNQLKNSGRRAFLKVGGTVAAGLLGQSASGQQLGGVSADSRNSASDKVLPVRNLGQTGYKVGIFSLGGQAAIEQADNQAVAVPIIERALDLGVNYIDTSSIYGGPKRWSERYVGEVMRRRRAEAFLASKTKERTRDGSLRMLEESLKLLQTDHLDLWQLHDIGVAEDVDAVFAKGGAMEALRQAHEQKMVRHLGVTGHYRPDALAECIRRYPFDTILMALNAADPHHFSFMDSLLPLAVEKRMGIIA